MTVLWCIVGVGIFGAWLPVETRPWTAVAIVATGLSLLPWAWSRTNLLTARRICLTALVWTIFVGLGLSGGWDRSQGLTELALAVLVAGVIWFASRARPSSVHITTWALGISALSVWGMMQSWGGLEQIRPAVEQLPPHLKLGALARIDQGRAFASLYLPGHLAVLLATVLPILVSRIGRDTLGILSGCAALCAAGGLMATRSPIGGILAGGACFAVLAARRRKLVHAVWMVPVAAVVIVMGLRPDVIQLEPLRLRFDNWGSALWTWFESPFGSVGLGGFGQASQAVPWEVGNHPVHAHSLPFELLAELGLAGLALWVVLIAGLFRIVIPLWRSKPEIAVALLIVPIHNLLDFSVYTSGVALPWAVLAGWGLALVSPPPVAKKDRGWRIVPVLVLAGGLGVALLNAASIVFENSAAQPGGDAFEQARRAAAIAPWRINPVDVAGKCALETPNALILEEATELVRRRRWQRPRSASRAQLQGRLAQLGRDPVAAAAHLWRAARIQPHDHRRQQDFDDLTDILEKQVHVAR